MTDLVTGEDFLRLFTSFEHTAFRLELRDQYNEPSERERFAAFLSGEAEQLDRLNKIQRVRWFDLMRDATSAGKRVERVRVVTEPHGDYTRYTLALTAGNASVGEDIRYLPRHHTSVSALPSWDYWLFDSRLVARLWFDDGGDSRLLGAELIEVPAQVVEHCAWRDAAWHYAIPHTEYTKG
ncbi:DUF6879 family protein [Planotetraspora kaengkrachanensis]|uniref:DUF6879 domain-containing protein n=1 Tax=Planotetraspora kaengkrachanensis TaxID=575193 RepID=A0A8J3PYD0_9ACTN|nr:DUF6879 family protein [Planotetraspora kaengkrachanensis]GIG83303.1 hypothetical protein Pka01_64300 [Planotetraspora kaengkrachanensis]